MRSCALRALVLGAFLAGFWLLTTTTASADPGIESCFTSKINGARAANGRASLRTRSDLVSIARNHSQKMANSGTIFHNSNLPNEAPSDWQKLGENVGMGPTCDDIHTAFMNSASHRKNILDPDFNTVGVGVVVSGDSTIFVTEVFMKEAAAPPPPPPPPPPPDGPKPSPSPRPPAKSPSPAAAVSKVKGNIRALLGLVEREDLPTDEELMAYADYRRQLKAEATAREKARKEKLKRDQDTFRLVSAYLAAILSAQI